MSVDKLVDSTQLDAACTYEAGKIREKLGSSAQIAYDLANGKGFGDAIAAIPSGGTDYLSQRLNDTLTDYESTDVTKISNYTLNRATNLERLVLPNCTTVGEYSCGYCTALKKLRLGLTGEIRINAFQRCDSLVVFDANYANDLYGNCFASSNNIQTFIFRSTSIVKLRSINSFSGTRLASGGAGATVYIPKVLYDHLGDGTSLDYKNTTNWSTLNGYGTITWAQIEGSYYETHYGDDTIIPT